MPRDPGGSYFLPAGNPVVPGTVIESDWANPTMADIGQEMSDSLSRSGKGGMLAALRGLDGTAAVPTFSFTNEPSSGRYRDGPGQVVESILGQPVVRYLASGLEQWDSNIMDWVPLTPRDALGTPFDPSPSNLTSTNVQDAIEEVNDKTGGTLTAESVTYDNTGTIFTTSNVQFVLNETSGYLSGLANDILDNSDAIQILQGEFDLLEPRVQQNEINIGTNTNNIALNTQQINANITDISNNANEISSIKLEQITQNSDILGNTNYIDNVYGITQTNAQNIAANASDISQNIADIASNTSAIGTNTSNISNLDIRVTANTNNITTNTNDISSLEVDVDWLNDRFNQNGGARRLDPAYGGTGTSTGVVTGTGNNVLSASPTISGGSWDNMTMNNGGANGANFNNCTANTPGDTDNDTSVATTAFVQNMLEHYNMTALWQGGNSNGQWWWWIGFRDAPTNVIIMYGFKNNGAGRHVVTFPAAFPGGSPGLVLTGTWDNGGSGNNGVDVTSMPDSAITSTGFTATTNRDFYWLAIGD